jgi:hypothetical protein
MTLATARPGRPAAATTARYTWVFADVVTTRRDGTPDYWGEHPVLVRTADGLMVPCTGAAPRRGEPACPVPADWTGRAYTRDGRVTQPWAKPLAAGRYAVRGAARPVTRTDVVTAADAAFAAADAARRPAGRVIRMY